MKSAAPGARLQHLEEAQALVRGQMRLVEEKLTGLEDMRTALRERLGRYEALRTQLLAQPSDGE
jgi:hypothetical protein